MLTCPPSMIPICVWMIGRFRRGMPIHELASLRHSLSPSVRRHLAKTLRRLEAWSLLRVMAAENPNDDRIQWFATAPTTHRPFSERLEMFTASLDDSHAGEVATPSRMPLLGSSIIAGRTRRRRALPPFATSCGEFGTGAVGRDLDSCANSSISFDVALTPSTISNALPARRSSLLSSA